MMIDCRQLFLVGIIVKAVVCIGIGNQLRQFIASGDTVFCLNTPFFAIIGIYIVRNGPEVSGRISQLHSIIAGFNHCIKNIGAKFFRFVTA